MVKKSIFDNCGLVYALRAIYSVCVVAGTTSVAVACPQSTSSSSAVSTPEAAVEAAKQAWESINEKTNSYSILSRESTERFEPCTAALKDGVWLVQGTIPPGYHGEILQSTVCQSDGSVSVTVVRAQ